MQARVQLLFQSYVLWGDQAVVSHERGQEGEGYEVGNLLSLYAE